jgi:hypothetical protein
VHDDAGAGVSSPSIAYVAASAESSQGRRLPVIESLASAHHDWIDCGAELAGVKAVSFFRLSGVTLC